MRADAAAAAKGKRSHGREVPLLRPTGRFGPQADLLQLRVPHYRSHRTFLIRPGLQPPEFEPGGLDGCLVVGRFHVSEDAALLQLGG